MPAKPALLALSAGVTLCVVAWGYLVKAAIDFGADGRAGRDEAWWFLGLASIGAMACLFIGLMLVARITRRLGITSVTEGAEPAAAVEPHPASPPRHSGGHRAGR